MLRAAMPEKLPSSGSRYKYRSMFSKLCRVTWARMTRINRNHHDFAIVEGDKCRDYRMAIRARVPYILTEQDIASLRFGPERYYPEEQRMIENAAAMLLTTEEVIDYLASRYTLPPTEVVHLRPLASDLEFKPRPKLPGRNIVYSGGIVPRSCADGSYGYRAYHDIFKRLMECGWTVHVFPAWHGADREKCYADIGCVVHDQIEQSDVYAVLSQFQAGFQGYAETGTGPSRDYIEICRPNKLWEYLGAGIPTFGYNTGTGSKVYDGKWGHVASSLDDFERVTDLVLNTEITDEMRYEQTMDHDLPVFERLVASCGLS